jgi:hypothetical protein
LTTRPSIDRPGIAVQVRVWTVTNQPTELNPARAPAPAESPPVTLAKFDGPTLNRDYPNTMQATRSGTVPSTIPRQFPSI